MVLRIAILGAGISGLALGWFLKKHQSHNIDLTILEASSRPGGWIQTISQDGFLFEQGPRSCRPHGTGIATLQLIEELGLQEHILFASPAARKRYLYINQKLQCLPTGPISFLTSPFRNDFLKALWRDWRSPKCGQNDESIHSFISRRLGTHFAESFFDPLVSGIYAGDIRELSIQSCFPLLQEWEQNHGSLISGAFTRKSTKEEHSSFVQNARRKGIFTLKDGMESLVKTLAHKLKDELRIGSTATHLRIGNGVTEISLADGNTITADHLYSTLSPKILASLLPIKYSNLVKKLETFATTSVAVVNVGYNHKVLPHEGFGYLIPSKENEEILGVVWDSSAFPGQNRYPEETRLTVMIGGTHMPNFGDLNENDFKVIALRALSKHLQIKQNPVSTAIKLAGNAIPQYVVGHGAKVREIEEEFRNLPAKITFSGNAVHGVSLNDCIKSATSYI